MHAGLPPSDLAHDARREPRNRTRGPRNEDLRLGGETGAAEPEFDARAAVNAGSVVSFTVVPEEKSDVLYSTKLAQRGANARYDRHAEAEAWYRVHSDVLK